MSREFYTEEEQKSRSWLKIMTNIIPKTLKSKTFLAPYWTEKQIR